MEMRFAESRSLLHEQMKITEELIRAAGERLDVRFSETVGRSISIKLQKFGFETTAVIAYYNSRNRLNAEVYFSAENAPDSNTRICDLIADELHLQLDCTEIVRSGNELQIRVFEKPAYSMEVYAASSCAENESANGDSHTVFTDGAGTGYVVLSDGSDLAFPLEKTGDRQWIDLGKRTIRWLRLERMIKSDDPSAFPSLRAWEVIGKDEGEQ